MKTYLKEETFKNIIDIYSVITHNLLGKKGWSQYSAHYPICRFFSSSVASLSSNSDN